MKLIVDGREAYAYTGGKPLDASKPCIVFVHGALHDHSVWTLLARWFAHHGHCVLALDLPGHGRSAAPLLPDLPAHGSWLIRVLDAAGIAQAALVGHSMGSLIALEAAAQAPDRVSALALVGTAYPMKVSDALLATARERPLQAMDMVNVFSHSTLAAKPAYPGPGAWLHGGNRQLMRRTQAGYREGNLFEHDFQLCNSYAGGEAAVARVQCPVSLMIGERDVMTAPKQSQWLAEQLKAQIYKLPAGHNLMAEAPDALLTALRRAFKA